MKSTKEFEKNTSEDEGVHSDDNSDEERAKNSSYCEDSFNSLNSEKGSSNNPEGKCPYNNSAFVYFCSMKYSFNCPNSCCPKTKNQCAGSSCYARCCPCYNEHFKCCLPAVINRPQHYPIIPVKKCPPQIYVPNKLRPNGKWNQKNGKNKKKKKKLKKDSLSGINNEADEVIRRILGELAEGLEGNAERDLRGVEEGVESPKKSPAPLKSSLPQREQETEIEEPYFCTGATSTQTSTPLIELLERRKNVMVDTSTPITPPCLRVLLRRVFEAKCATAGDCSNHKTRYCDFSELCKCTRPYEQREMIEEGGVFGDGLTETLKRGVSECPCFSRGCRGSCGYQPDGRRILGMLGVSRKDPCLPNCEYYNV